MSQDVLGPWETPPFIPLFARAIHVLGIPQSGEPGHDRYDYVMVFGEAPFDDADLVNACDRLKEDGLLYLQTTHHGAERVERLKAVLAACGLCPYPARRPREQTRYTLIAPPMNEVDPCAGQGMLWAAPAYDPLAHARRLEGRHAAAFEILDMVTQVRLEDPVYLLQVLLEMQLLLLAMDDKDSSADLLTRFFWAQEIYYRILNLLPSSSEACLCQAAFWRRIGRSDMARRLLRNMQSAYPCPDVRKALEQIPVLEPAPPSAGAPPPAPPEFRPRCLMLGHSSADCGFDLLYDGLCRILGAENVVDYPWKAHLHGTPLNEEIRHPCACNHPGAPVAVDELVEQLRGNRFDLILYAEALDLTGADVDRILAANPGVPVFLADTQDQGYSVFETMRARAGKARVLGCFKREMVVGRSYGERVWPLPLAIMDHTIPEAPRAERRDGLFYAGHRNLGNRRLYLDSLEKHLDQKFPDHLPPHQYRAAMSNAAIALDFFGLGYDTMRYYEAPACQCLLLAEKRPIHIPNNFRDGLEAAFFEDIPELFEKASYYLNHPEECREIAQAGRERLLRWHTSSARGRQFLDRVYNALQADDLRP